MSNLAAVNKNLQTVIVLKEKGQYCSGGFRGMADRPTPPLCLGTCREIAKICNIGGYQITRKTVQLLETTPQPPYYVLPLKSQIGHCY